MIRVVMHPARFAPALVVLLACAKQESLVLSEVEMQRSIGQCFKTSAMSTIVGPISSVQKHPAAGRLSWVIETSDSALLFMHPGVGEPVACPADRSDEWRRTQGMPAQ